MVRRRDVVRLVNALAASRAQAQMVRDSAMATVQAAGSVVRMALQARREMAKVLVPAAGLKARRRAMVKARVMVVHAASAESSNVNSIAARHREIAMMTIGVQEDMTGMTMTMTKKAAETRSKPRFDLSR